MLILTRRVGEAITIGDHIKIRILGQKSGHVRFGFEAPASVAIDREEIAERKKGRLAPDMGQRRTL